MMHLNKAMVMPLPKMDMVTLDDAKKILYENIKLSRYFEELDTTESVGRVLAESLYAQNPSPPGPRSAMDGFAFKFSDVQELLRDADHPVHLKIVGKVRLGEGSKNFSGERNCVQVATGSIVPAPFDTVVPVENVKIDGDSIILTKEIKKGANIDPTGSDYPKGSEFFESGHIIRPKDVPFLLSIGRDRVRVLKKFKVVVVPTGDELVPYDIKNSEHGIKDSNSWGIKNLLDESGLFQTTHHAIVPDDREKIRETLRKALKRYDVVITLGGSSFGERDYVYRVVQEFKPGIIFHGVKIKPGMPTFFAKDGEKIIVGLPGPAVSGMMSMVELFLPAFMHEAGINGFEFKIKAIIAETVKLSKGKVNLIPVALRKGSSCACPITGSSSDGSRLARAQGYISYEGKTGFLERGTPVNVKLFSVLPL